MTPPLPILRPCNVSRANLRRASSINGLSAKGLGLHAKKKEGGGGGGGEDVRDSSWQSFINSLFLKIYLNPN